MINSAVLMGLKLMTSVKEVFWIPNIWIFLWVDKWSLKSYFCDLLMHCYPNWIFLWIFLYFIILIVSISYLDYYIVTPKVVDQGDRSFFKSSQLLKHTKKPEECQLNPQLVRIWNSSWIVPSHWQAAALCSHHLEMFPQALCQIWDCNSISKPEMPISVCRHSDQSNGTVPDNLRHYFQE